MIGPWTSGRTFRCKIRTQKLWRLSCCRRTSFRLTRTWCRCKQDLWKRHYCTCSLSCCGCWCCLRCWNRCRRCRVLTVDPTWPKIEHFLKRKFMLAKKIYLVLLYEIINRYRLADNARYSVGRLKYFITLLDTALSFLKKMGQLPVSFLFIFVFSNSKFTEKNCRRHQCSQSNTIPLFNDRRQSRFRKIVYDRLSGCCQKFAKLLEIRDLDFCIKSVALWQINLLTRQIDI